MSLDLLCSLGVLVVSCGSGLCLFSLFMVSNRFLYVLISLENMNCLLLMGSLVSFLPFEATCFVALLVVFTIEAVVGLVVLIRVWVGGVLAGLGWW